MHTKLDNVHAGSAPSGSALSVGGDLIPGSGLPNLHIGHTKQQVQRLLGIPDQNVSFADQEFFIYRSRGLDIDFGASKNFVSRLFFYGEDIEGHDNAAAIQANGIQLGSTREQVEAKFGLPDREGGPVRVANRKKSWIYYASGIQFEFDVRGRVIIITIFAAQSH